MLHDSTHPSGLFCAQRTVADHPPHCLDVPLRDFVSSVLSRKCEQAVGLGWTMKFAVVVHQVSSRGPSSGVSVAFSHQCPLGPLVIFSAVSSRTVPK
jgi:hypothetical protein